MPERHRMIIEGFGCQTKSLTECSSFMTQLVSTLGTLEIARIQVNVIPKKILNSKNHEAALGVTILVEYLESGASLRTWPEEAFASLDIFSCKGFVRQSIINAFEAFFRSNRWTVIL